MKYTVYNMVSQREILSRLQLVEAYNRTGSYAQAAKQEKTDWRRVHRWAKRWKEIGPVGDKLRTGRPRKDLDSAKAKAIIFQALDEENCIPHCAKDLKNNLPSLMNESHPEIIDQWSGR